MSYTVRDVQISEHPALIEQFRGILANCKTRTGKAWLDELDLPTAVDFIVNRCQTVIIDEAFFLAYLILPMPLTLSDVVQEVVFFRVAGGGKVADVLTFLEDEAKAQACKGVIVGSGLRGDDLDFASHLRAHGYTPLSFDHFKPLKE